MHFDRQHKRDRKIFHYLLKNSSIDYYIDFLHYFVNVIEMYRLIYVPQLNDSFTHHKVLPESEKINKMGENRRKRHTSDSFSR
jgi:hypothetical protein